MKIKGRGSKRATPARMIALVGIMAATVECGKLALSFLPNVEVVTLLLALYGYVFGLLGVVAALVFVSIEPLIYGFNTWVVSYYLYWPLVSLVFMLFAKLKVKNRFILTAGAVLLTAWFGVLSTLVDLGILSGFFDNFLYRFSIYYARGAVFYIIQMACNAVLFPLLFKFLAGKLERIKHQFI
jgi:hypothetical protein